MSTIRRDSDRLAARALLHDLDDIGDPFIRAAEMKTDRTPPRVAVSLKSGQIPDPIQDVIDAHAATIHNPRSNGGRIEFDLVPETRWENVGNSPIRPHGTSMVVNVTARPMQLANLKERDEVVRYARPGEILLRSRDLESLRSVR